MPKRLGSSDVIRVLQEHGFFFASQKGSHAKLLLLVFSALHSIRIEHYYEDILTTDVTDRHG